MTRLVRVLGYLLIGAGALVLGSYFFEPLQRLWLVFLALPWPIRIGLGIAGVGLLLILGSMIWERIEERDSDRDLLDEP